MSTNYQRQKEIDQAKAYLENLQGHTGQAFVDVNKREDIKVHIEIDNSLKPGQFKPHPKLHSIWYTSSQTFRAMKKDVFSIFGIEIFLV